MWSGWVMADTDSLVVEAAERLLGDLCDPQTVNNAKDDGWRDRLWQALAENGLIHASIPGNSEDRAQS